MKKILIFAIAIFWDSPANAQILDPNNDGVAFGHVHVRVTDRALHVALWTELFGAVLIEKQGYMAVSVPGSLVFFTEGEPTAPSRETAVDHFALEVRDLGSVVEKWRVHGYELTTDISTSGNLVAMLSMPDGIQLELVENPDLAVSARMDHVHFFARELVGFTEMYREYFGAVEKRGSNSNIFEVPGSKLIFDHTEETRAPTDGTAIDHIGFEIISWEPFIEMLENRNVKFEFGPVYIESLDLWVAFFNDPAGVSVEVTHGLNHF